MDPNNDDRFRSGAPAGRSGNGTGLFPVRARRAEQLHPRRPARARVRRDDLDQGATSRFVN